MIPNQIFIAVFIVATLIHLYASFVWNVKLRNITKPFVVLPLLLYYVFASDNIMITMVLALFFSWIGDLLLIPKGLRFFVAGGIAFIASHFFFVASFIPHINFEILPPWIVISLSALYLMASVCIVNKLSSDIHKPLRPPVYAYLLVNAINNCFAFFMLLSSPSMGAAIAFVGTILFFVSDSVLLHVRFKQGTSWKTHAPVMLTYAFAELYITIGMMMI